MSTATNPRLSSHMLFWHLLTFCIVVFHQSRVIEAKLPSFTDCEEMNCIYCKTKRMMADCRSYCQNWCKVEQDSDSDNSKRNRGKNESDRNDNRKGSDDDDQSESSNNNDNENNSNNSNGGGGGSLSANEKFGRCCQQQKKLGRIKSPGCFKFCKWENLNENTLVDAFFTRSCGGNEVGPIFACASQEQEQIKCCSPDMTGEHKKCLDLCDPNRNLNIDPSFVICLGKIKYMNKCYKKHMISLPDSRFPEIRR